MRAQTEGDRLRYLDAVCAWLIFVAGLVHVVLTEIPHFRGSLDTALVWILAAMLNLVRINSGYPVRRLKIFCVAANVSVLTIEAVRWRMFEGPLSLVLLVLILIESAFSIASKTVEANQPTVKLGGEAL